MTPYLEEKEDAYMKIGYVRCSTTHQNTARQEILMEQLGVERVFIDKQTGTNTNRRWDISTIRIKLTVTE